MIRHVPNALSLTRILLLPPLLVAAMAAESRSWFLGLLGTAGLTDALDGWIARRFKVESERGRLLDSWGDYVTALLCVAGLAWLWPETMAREWAWFATGVTAFFGIVVYGVVRHRRALAYHTWLAKAVAIATPFALAPLMLAWSAVPFHCVVVLQVLGAIEEATIAVLLPGVSSEVPTVWHAWRRRESKPASPTGGGQIAGIRGS